MDNISDCQSPKYIIDECYYKLLEPFSLAKIDDCKCNFPEFPIDVIYTVIDCSGVEQTNVIIEPKVTEIQPENIVIRTIGNETTGVYGNFQRDDTLTDIKGDCRVWLIK